MNRSIANWLATNPGGAVFATGLLGLLPFFGIGFFFFLPGAVPALLALARGPRQGAMVAAGASLLLALAIWFIGRSVPVGVIYAFWVLGPPLALAWVLRRTGSLSLCLQLATLAGIGLVIGVAGAVALTGVMRTLLYEVEPSDPLAVIVAIALLGITALAATIVPARRAMRVDPVQLLRES